MSSHGAAAASHLALSFPSVAAPVAMMVVLVLATIAVLFVAAGVTARHRTYAGAAQDGSSVPAAAATVMDEVRKALPLGDGVGTSRLGGLLAPVQGSAVDSGADGIGPEFHAGMD